MDIYLQNCTKCQKRTPVAAMIAVLGKRYCEGCGSELAKLVRSQNAEPRYRRIIEGPRPGMAEKRPRNAVKWWDVKRGEWRWVSKRSKPELKPHPEQ